MSKFRSLAILAFASLTIATSCKSNLHNGYPIVLLAPLSGAQSTLGVQIDRARLIVQKELDDAHDTSVYLDEVDTSGQPTQAKAAVDHALDHDHAHFIVGSLLSSETRNFLEDVLARGSVVVANGSSDTQIRTLPFRHPRDGFFRNWPPDDAEGKAMAEYVYGSQNAKKIAVFSADDAYALALTHTFITRFRQLGGTANEAEVYPTTATSFESIINRIDPGSVNGYYIVGLPKDLAGMYTALRSNKKSSGTKIFSAVAADTTEFTALVHQPLTLLYYTAPASDLTSPEYFRFKEAYKSMFKGDSPDIVAAITYDALHITIDAVERSHNDSAAAMQWLYSMPPYNGVTGPTKFDVLGDVISKPLAIRFYEKGLSRLALTTSSR